MMQEGLLKKMKVERILLILVAIIFGAVMVRANNQNPNTSDMPSKKTNGGRIMKHELPPLPYDYDALEPYYDEATLRVHHDKHH